jgi:hypothetical protein
VTGTLTASLTNGTLTCPEYTVSSDELSFNINVTAGSVVGMTKSVTFSYPVPAGDTRVASEYQVCFRAPYNFPALLPSQLVQDVNNADFSGNTVPDGAQFKGLLLHCGLGQGVPCVQSRAIAGGLVTVTVAVPALDPGMKL